MITYTGKMLNGPEDAPELEDITISLARMCRFNGFSTIFWTVLQHSFAVEDILEPEYKIYGLLHDAAECITGDIPRPVKPDVMARMEDILMTSIYKSLNIPEPSSKAKLYVKEADDRVLYAECVLFGPPETSKHLGFSYPEDTKTLDVVSSYIVPGERIYDDLLAPNSPLQQRFLDKLKGLI